MLPRCAASPAIVPCRHRAPEASAPAAANGNPSHLLLTVCARVVIPAADDDGFITFEEFMVSYARPKPILKNLLIMAINTAVIFFILQAPWLDTMIKVRHASRVLAAA